jgi:hypothetical protein
MNSCSRADDAYACGSRRLFKECHGILFGLNEPSRAEKTMYGGRAKEVI